MVEDNTPTVTSKKRKPTAHMRLRLETVKRLKKLDTKSKKPAADAQLSKDAVKDTVTAKITTPGVVARPPKIKKNALQKPPKPKAKFRKRQIFKSWLPTHLYHAKRAHMTPPKEPLWRMAIPLSPTVKSYRPTHRASTARGAVAWDMSYISTIGLEGPEMSIKGLFRALGVKGPDIQDCANDADSKWTRGTRSWEGWVHESSTQPSKSIAPVLIVWCAQEQAVEGAESDISISIDANHKNSRKAFIRVHPAGFLQLWEEVLRLAKSQKPAVMVEDLRFEIGSIEVTGPSSTEALVGALWPCSTDGGGSTRTDSPQAVWPLLSSLTNPASLPKNVILGFEISDPRLHHPPRKVTEVHSETAHQRLLETLATWPPDKTQEPPKIFSPASRFSACRELPSQKAINRRKALASPGEYPQPQKSDPKIPILLLASRSSGSNTGSWTVLLPWKCVLPAWYSIMYHPLSSGGTARFGGLDEKRQVAFETGTPWFPGDYPGTKAGMAWEEQERTKRKAAWEKRPKGKRTEWQSVSLGKDRKGEIGLGWACDWTHLSKSAPDTEESKTKEVHHVEALDASSLLSSLSPVDSAETVSNTLFTVRLDMVSRGVMTNCARIYRLPTKDLELRQQWLALLPSSSHKAVAKETRPHRPAKDAASHMRRQYLAASLLSPIEKGKIRAGDAGYPVVPDEHDLIGFVTTGNFNLGEGRGTGVGCLLMSRVLEARADGRKPAFPLEKHLCIVREVGQAVGRLARWTVV